ncbi:MAG: AAA family ATPase, partial [Lachnospiraceae bacterium]|nr:AAA family ATPase [Lachnospiraceae bacterium]
MLCQFSFKNFKSYRDETTFDFQATSLLEFSDSLITEEKAVSLLPVGVVYGPNGGGKSNLLQALACVISMIVKPVHDLNKNRMNFILQQHVDAVPFLLDETSASEPTEFRMYIRIGQNEYCYCISVKNDEIMSESLSRKTIIGKKSAEIFDREGANITLGYSINKKGINTNINPKMPYLSFLAINYDIPAITEVISWFESCIIRSYGIPMVEERIILANDAQNKRQ